jgi:hypothetical protein
MEIVYGDANLYNGNYACAAGGDCQSGYSCTARGQFHNSSLGPCSFPDRLSIETAIAAMRRKASFTVLAHSIVPSLQARIHSATRC